MRGFLALGILRRNLIVIVSEAKFTLFCHCEEHSDEAIYDFKIPYAKFAFHARKFSQ